MRKAGWKHESRGLGTLSPRPAACVRPLPDLLSLLPAYEAGRPVRSRFGLRAHRPIGQTDSFLGILSCLSQYPVRLDQQLAIDPCCPSKTHRRMSSISRSASSRLANRRASQCDLTAHAPDSSGARPNRLAATGHLRSCAPQALPPLRASGLVPPQHRRAKEEMQELSPSRRGTAVPGLQQLPSPDSLMTSNSVDGLSELV